MATLSDVDIRRAVLQGDIAIDQWGDLESSGRLQPASVDLLLGDEFLRPLGVTSVLSFREGGSKPRYEKVDGPVTLTPHQFILGVTRERLRLGAKLRASVEGKSTIGRWGLCVHVTAGFIDPGFDGRITLELVNHSPNVIELVPGMKICQVAFHMMLSQPSELYGSKKFGSHYQGSDGVVAPK